MFRVTYLKHVSTIYFQRNLLFNFTLGTPSFRSVSRGLYQKVFPRLAGNCGSQSWRNRPKLKYHSDRKIIIFFPRREEEKILRRKGCQPGASHFNQQDTYKMKGIFPLRCATSSAIFRRSDRETPGKIKSLSLRRHPRRRSNKIFRSVRKFCIVPTDKERMSVIQPEFM